MVDLFLLSVNEKALPFPPLLTHLIPPRSERRQEIQVVLCNNNQNLPGYQRQSRSPRHHLTFSVPYPLFLIVALSDCCYRYRSDRPPAKALRLRYPGHYWAGDRTGPRQLKIFGLPSLLSPTFATLPHFDPACSCNLFSQQILSEWTAPVLDSLVPRSPISTVRLRLRLALC